MKNYLKRIENGKTTKSNCPSGIVQEKSRRIDLDGKVKVKW